MFFLFPFPYLMMLLEPQSPWGHLRGAGRRRRESSNTMVTNSDLWIVLFSMSMYMC